MEFSITLTEEDIKNYPNNYELGTFIKKHYIQYLSLKFDKCLTCGKESSYTDDSPIEDRVGYVEGLGQVCFEPNICQI